jgi:hypothetical protein
MKFAPKYRRSNVLLCSISPSSGKPAARRRQGNSPKARVPLGNTGRGLIAYPGFPHGMCTTNADVINADLLAFIRS